MFKEKFKTIQPLLTALRKPFIMNCQSGLVPNEKI